MADRAEAQLFEELLQAAEHKISERLAVTEVSSVWSPMVLGDKGLAGNIAAEMAQLIEDSGSEITNEELHRMVSFGAAVGALSLRKLFQPFMSDQIWIDYREGSGLTQGDAVRKVRNGVGHPHGARVV